MVVNALVYLLLLLATVVELEGMLVLPALTGNAHWDVPLANTVSPLKLADIPTQRVQQALPVPPEWSLSQLAAATLLATLPAQQLGALLVQQLETLPAILRALLTQATPIVAQIPAPTQMVLKQVEAPQPLLLRDLV
jgi:hypothetical protein